MTTRLASKPQGLLYEHAFALCGGGIGAESFNRSLMFQQSAIVACFLSEHREHHFLVRFTTERRASGLYVVARLREVVEGATE